MMVMKETSLIIFLHFGYVVNRFQYESVVVKNINSRLTCFEISRVRCFTMKYNALESTVCTVWPLQINIL